MIKKVKLPENSDKWTYALDKSPQYGNNMYWMLHDPPDNACNELTMSFLSMWAGMLSTYSPWAYPDILQFERAILSTQK